MPDKRVILNAAGQPADESDLICELLNEVFTGALCLRHEAGLARQRGDVKQANLLAYKAEKMLKAHQDYLDFDHG